jgi:ferredoxin-thioredoxin reductase catalytic chain
MYDFAARVTSRRGWSLNPDTGHVSSVLSGLETNRNRYGYLLCPCRDGDGERTKDEDIICPCRYAEEDIDEYGHCYCGLFVGDAVASGESEVQPIPERRFDEPADTSELSPARRDDLPVTVRDLCSIKDVIREINELERELKAAYGLSVNEALCLCCVSSASRTPGECAVQMGLSASRVSRLLSALERKGLLERRAHPGDLRVTGLEVTEEGLDRLSVMRRGGITFSKLDAISAGAPRGRERVV